MLRWLLSLWLKSNAILKQFLELISMNRQNAKGSSYSEFRFTIRWLKSVAISKFALSLSTLSRSCNDSRIQMFWQIWCTDSTKKKPSVTQHKYVLNKFLTADRSCKKNIFEKTFIEVGSPHLYASFGTFCAKINQLFVHTT